MGHYDLDYEYENDRKILSSKAFDEKWGSAKGLVGDEKFILNSPKKTFSDSETLTLNEVTEIRLSMKEGKFKIVIDINEKPTYDFTLNRKQSNEFLMQLFHNIKNG